MPFSTRHTLEAVGICPNNGLPDRYTIRVYPGPDRVMFCERIVEVVDGLLVRPIFQERFTQELADRLGCRVETTCGHLAGDRVTVECEACPADAAA